MPAPSKALTLLAFAIIYLVWGSTFLAIRIGVHELPPLLFASMRFTAAGFVLFLWVLARREPWPTPRQWLSILLLATLIFLVDYGLLFWAEQRVPSGLAAVMLASIPVFTAFAEIALLRTQRLTPRLVAALLIGLAGVAVLMVPSLNFGDAPVDPAGAIALLVGALSWSVATVLSRKLPLTRSRVMNSGAQMLTGGILLAAASFALGEPHAFHPAAVSSNAWMALVYLIVFGSIIGFTAYVWLVSHQSPTVVGTYAYVNPLVAVLLGYFVASEPLGIRTGLGSICVLLSVIVITTTRPKSPALAQS